MPYSNTNFSGSGIEDIESEDHKSSIQSLFEKIKSYLETRIELLKLKAIDKSSSVVSFIVTFIAVFLIFACFFVFINIGLALLIGDLLGKSYYGFFIIAAFYAVAGIILLKNRNKWVKTPLINMMVKSLHE